MDMKIVKVLLVAIASITLVACAAQEEEEMMVKEEPTMGKL